MVIYIIRRVEKFGILATRAYGNMNHINLKSEVQGNVNNDEDVTALIGESFSKFGKLESLRKNNEFRVSVLFQMNWMDVNEQEKFNQFWNF